MIYKWGHVDKDLKSPESIFDFVGQLYEENWEFNDMSVGS